jgi:hypothetical protein
MYESTATCENCGNEISDDSEFCSYCGALFLDNTNCDKHESRDAEGVCIICRLPYCTECGSFVNKQFLCNEHSEYEIYEGMCRVFGSEDQMQVEYAMDCLKKSGLHPFLYSRKVSPISLGGPDYSLFRPSGDFRTHLVNEIKLMIPLPEALEAEEILRDLEML